MLVCAYKSSLVVTIAGLSLSAMGSFGTLGPFWAMPPAFLRGVSAAAGIALINSVGNFCGGLIAPKVMGRLIDEKEPNSYVKGLGLYAIMLVLAGCVALTLKMKGTGKSVVGPAVMPEVEV
jgi:ACS family tartrate transporter-like MFS transporter